MSDSDTNPNASPGIPEIETKVPNPNPPPHSFPREIIGIVFSMVAGEFHWFDGRWKRPGLCELGCSLFAHGLGRVDWAEEVLSWYNRDLYLDADRVVAIWPYASGREAIGTELR